MPRSLPALLILLGATAAHAQFAPTRCTTTTAMVFGSLPMRVLAGCGDQFQENTLWHLDRTDQVSLPLDNRSYRGHGGRGSVIYIMDAGVLATHDEFKTAGGGSRVIAGLDAVSSLPGSDVTCPNAVLAPCAGSPVVLGLISHGTAVASVAAGANVGIAPEASIVAVRVIAVRTPLYSMRTVSDGLDAIVRHAFDPATPQFSTGIISISFALRPDDYPEGPTAAELEAKMRRMTEGVDRNGNPDPNGKRFFFAIAAGNSNQGEGEWCDPGGLTKLFPSTVGPKIDGVMTVGGSAKDNGVWPSSCRGEEVFAPAEDLLVASSSANNHYRDPNGLLTSGTSWSAPIVAGIAARLLELDPTLTPQQLETRIEASPSKLNTGETEAVFLPPAAPPRHRAVVHAALEPEVIGAVQRLKRRIVAGGATTVDVPAGDATHMRVHVEDVDVPEGATISVERRRSISTAAPTTCGCPPSAAAWPWWRSSRRRRASSSPKWP